MQKRLRRDLHVSVYGRKRVQRSGITARRWDAPTRPNLANDGMQIAPGTPHGSLAVSRLQLQNAFPVINYIRGEIYKSFHVA